MRKSMGGAGLVGKKAVVDVIKATMTWILCSALAIRGLCGAVIVQADCVRCKRRSRWCN